MHRVVLWLLLGTAFVCGCGRPEPKHLIQQHIRTLEQLADALEKGQSQEKIERLEKQLNEITKQVGKFSVEKKSELYRRYKDDWTKALKRYKSARRRAR